MMKRKGISILVIMLIVMMALTALTGCSPGGGIEKADTVIIGNIYTVDAEGNTAQALAIKDGIYQYVGDEEGVQEYIGDSTEVIKTDGGMVMPGFFEAHAHASQGGVGNLFEVNLYEGTSMDDYIATVAEFVKTHPEQKFITGAGWINGYCPKGGPTKEALDQISKDIPIAIISGDHHSYWANSKALELAGITADTPDVKGGVIERNPATKEPTGTVRENANALITAIIPDYSVEQYKQGILAYQDEVKAYGITAYFEPMVNINGGTNLLEAYNELDKEGKLEMRVYGGLQILPDQDPLNYLDECVNLKEDSKGGNFEINAIKIFIDGVVEGKTAYLIDDYASDPGFRGEPLWNQDLLNQVCAKADKLGLRIETHAIGDAAVKMIVDAYEYTAKTNNTKDSRHSITHLQVVDTADIERMAKLNVIASTNPYWFCKEPGYFYEVEVPYLGEDRANREYPMKSFFDTGVKVTVASDYPVTIPSMPLQAVQTGVIRCDRFGDEKTLQNPDQRVTVQQMIEAATINGAYENFADDRIGSIEKGKNADLIILDQDLLKIDPFEIGKTQVLRTIFQGRTVYKM